LNAVVGHPAFFAGTDSAPHSSAAKRSGDGGIPAGCYTSCCAVEMYAHALHKSMSAKQNAASTSFLQSGDLSPLMVHEMSTRLEKFLARNGEVFYGLSMPPPVNVVHLRLVQRKWRVPLALPFGGGDDGGTVEPVCAGRELQWQCEWVRASLN
jgi:dihydroorotase